MSDQQQPLALESAARLVCLLNDEIVADRGDGKVADDVRQQLEVVYYKLTDAHRDFLRDLSGDLYMFSDTEVLIPSSREDPSNVYDFSNSLKNYMSRGQYSHILHLLRLNIRVMSVFTRDQISYMRSRSYGALGFPFVAYKFMAFSWKCRPQHGPYHALAMYLAQASGEHAAAEAAARAVIEGNTKSVEAVILAGSIILRRLRALPKQQSEQVVDSSVSRTKAALSTTPLKGLKNVKLMTLGYTQLGVYADHMGDTEQAIKYYHEAYSLESSQAVRQQFELLINRLIAARSLEPDAIHNLLDNVTEEAANADLALVAA